MRDAGHEVALELVGDAQRLDLHGQHPVQPLEAGQQVGPLDRHRRLGREQAGHGGSPIGQPPHAMFPRDDQHADRRSVPHHRLPQRRHGAGCVHQPL